VVLQKWLRKAPLALAMALIVIVPSLGEDRPGTIDEILLIDKSLSMRGSIDAVKSYAATRLISSILVPGDRLIIEAFYGKIERVFGGTIRSAADKDLAIKSLDGIVADGAFTDIGAVLDRASADLVELGNPDRPKYVVLLTDERQEAPPGSRYVSSDYRLVHPALTYIRRIDHGAYREIIVGLDVAAKVDKAAPSIMKILSEPPARSDADFPPLPADTPPGLAIGGATGDTTNGGARAGGDPNRTGASGGNPLSSGQGGGSSNSEGSPPSWIIPFILGLVFLAGAAVVTLVLIRRRKRDRELHDS